MKLFVSVSGSRLLVQYVFCLSSVQGFGLTVFSFSISYKGFDLDHSFRLTVFLSASFVFFVFGHSLGRFFCGYEKMKA